MPTYNPQIPAWGSWNAPSQNQSAIASGSASPLPQTIGGSGSTNPLGGVNQAQLPSSYGQAQPISAQLPQTSSASGGYTPYAQEIQQLAQQGTLFNPQTLPGGRMTDLPATPAGVNPFDLPVATMVGGQTMPGGRVSGGTPTYSPYAQTGYQSLVPRMQGSDPSFAAHALNDYAIGLGPPTGGLGIDYSQLQSDVNSPGFQAALNPNVGLPPGYQSWQQQQDWGSLLGNMNAFTARASVPANANYYLDEQGNKVYKR